MEIKDLGMIDVKNMYGIGAIRNHKNLQLVVELVKGEKKKIHNPKDARNEKITIVHSEL